MQDGVSVKGGGIRGVKGVERKVDLFLLLREWRKDFGRGWVLDRGRNFVRGIDRVEFTVHRGAARGFGLGGLGYSLIS